MIEYGFYHPDIGYWQMISEPSNEDLMKFPEGTISVPLKPGSFYDWNGTEWVFNEPILTPEEKRAQFPNLTPVQFRNALVDNGIMPDQVTEKIMTIPFDIEREKALNSWNYPTMFIRNDPYIDMISAMFDLTPEQVDVMWMDAYENYK